MTDVAKFYDEFAHQQARSGINRRHLSILKYLKQFGLQPSHRVLEIGCGIGTLTELLCTYCPAGHVHAVDISPASIEMARKRLAGYKNLKLEAADAVVDEIAGTYDVVVLPDVIEHIPIQLHPALWKRIASVLTPQAFVAVHIPDPYFLKNMINAGSNELQVIDQPIYADQLTRDTYAAGLRLEYLEAYCLHTAQPDYQIMKLSPVTTANYTPLIRAGKVKRMLSRWLKK